MRDLGVKEVDRLRKTQGTFRVSKGLYLQVAGGSTSWLHRYMLAGKAVAMGLGPYDLVSLQDARDAVLDNRKLIRTGVCPLSQRRADRPAVRKTFAEVARDYHAAHSNKWTAARYAAQWLRDLERYVFPSLGAKPIDLINAEEVRDTFRAIWPGWKDATHPLSIARLILDRCRDVWFSAKPLGWVHGDNPFAWEGCQQSLLGSYTKTRKHHPSLPWRDMPQFMSELRGVDSLNALALEFTILCAVRSDDVLDARWGEIDFDKAVWTLPKTKNGDAHEVPLADRAMAILRSLDSNRNPEGVIFARPDGQRMWHSAMLELLDTFGRTDPTGQRVVVHGFRAGFRGYAIANGHLEIVAELGLAHRQKTDVLEAYTRNHDLWRERVTLMARWADHCCG